MYSRFEEVDKMTLDLSLLKIISVLFPSVAGVSEKVGNNEETKTRRWDEGFYIKKEKSDRWPQKNSTDFIASVTIPLWTDLKNQEDVKWHFSSWSRKDPFF